MMVLCKFCKHYEPSKHQADDAGYARCKATESFETSPVDGSTVRNIGFCDLERKEAGRCGPAAKLFEPVDETTQRVGS